MQQKPLVFAIVVLCVAFFMSVSQAATKQQHARHMAQVGMHHDAAAGRENVFYHSGNLGPLAARAAARAAWRNSPGHRANLPMFGLRVSRGNGGTYVVGR